MGTFGGDLLRILAHGVMNTGTTALGQYLGNVFEQGRAEKLLGAKTALDSATYEQDPIRQQEILGQLKDRFNLPMVTNKGFVPVGETPSLSNLGMKKGLTYPEATYQPAEVKSIVAPVPSLDIMKSRVASSLPLNELKTALFPKDSTLQAARENLLANLAFKGQEGEANRASRESIAQQHNELMASNAADRRSQQDTWRQFLMTHMQDKLDVMKEKGATAEEQRELSQAIALQNQISLATGDQKKMLQIQLNKMVEATKSPILKSFPLYTEDIDIPDSKAKVLGIPVPFTGKTQKVPVGSKMKEPAAVQKIPSQAEIDAELKRRGIQ